MTSKSSFSRAKPRRAWVREHFRRLPPVEDERRRKCGQASKSTSKIPFAPCDWLKPTVRPCDANLSIFLFLDGEGFDSHSPLWLRHELSSQVSVKAMGARSREPSETLSHMESLSPSPCVDAVTTTVRPCDANLSFSVVVAKTETRNRLMFPVVLCKGLNFLKINVIIIKTFAMRYI